MRKSFKYKCTTFLILNNLPYKYESRSLTWLPCLLLFCFHIAVKNMDSLGWSSMYVVKQNYNLDRDLWSRIKMEGNKYCHLLHYVERGTRIWSWEVQEMGAGVQGARTCRGRHTSAADIRKWSCSSIHTLGMGLSILCVTDTLVAVGGLVCCGQGEDGLLVDTPGLGCIALPGTFLQLDHEIKHHFLDQCPECCGQIWSPHTSWNSNLTLMYWYWLDNLTVI